MLNKVFGLDSLAEYTCSVAQYKNVPPCEMSAVMANTVSIADKNVRTYHESMGLKDG